MVPSFYVEKSKTAKYTPEGSGILLICERISGVARGQAFFTQVFIGGGGAPNGPSEQFNKNCALHPANQFR